MNRQHLGDICKICTFFLIQNVVDGKKFEILFFNEKGQWNTERSQGAAFHFVSSEVMRTIFFVL